MRCLTQRSNHTRVGQHGINLVDLMMWLVIAALLLAAAIQGIGYYQKAAYLNQLKSDLSGAGSQVMSVASMENGVITKSVLDTAAANTKWSEQVVHSVEEATEGKMPYIRATHPGVTDLDAIYLFEACAPYNIGVNVVPKSGDGFLEDCGIMPPPESTESDGGSSGPSPEDLDGDRIPNSADSDMDGDGTPNATDPDVDGDGLINGSDNDADGDGTDDDAALLASYTPGGPITTVDGTPYPYRGAFSWSRINTGGTNIYAVISTDANVSGKALASHAVLTCVRANKTTHVVNKIITVTPVNNTASAYATNVTGCGTDRIHSYTIKPLTTEAMASGIIQNPEAFTSGFTVSGGYRWTEPDGYPVQGAFSWAVVNSGGQNIYAVFSTPAGANGNRIVSHYTVTCVRPDQTTYKVSRLAHVTSNVSGASAYATNLAHCSDGHISAFEFKPLTKLGLVENPEAFTTGFTASGTYSWTEATNGYRTGGQFASALLNNGGTNVYTVFSADNGLVNQTMATQYKLTCIKPDGSTREVNRLATITSTSNTGVGYAANLTGCGTDRIIAYSLKPVESLGAVQNPEAFTSGYSLRGTYEWSEAVNGYTKRGGVYASSHVNNGGSNVYVVYSADNGMNGIRMASQYSLVCERSDQTTYKVNRLATITSTSSTGVGYAANLSGCGTDQVIEYTINKVTDLGAVSNPADFTSGYILEGGTTWKESTNGYTRVGGTFSSATRSADGRTINTVFVVSAGLSGQTINAQYALVCKASNGNTYTLNRLLSITSTSSSSLGYTAALSCGADQAESVKIDRVTDLGIVDNRSVFTSGYTFTGTYNWTK